MMAMRRKKVRRNRSFSPDEQAIERDNAGLEAQSLADVANSERDDATAEDRPIDPGATTDWLESISGPVTLLDRDPAHKPLATELVAMILPKRGVSPEEKEAYSDLERKVTQIFEPGDVIDQFEISRVTNLMWECSSITRYQNSLIANAREESLRMLLDGRVENAREIAEGVRRGEQASIDRARGILAKAGLSEEDVHAQSYISHLATIERLKRIEAVALKEITRLLRDLDYRKMVREQVRLRKLFEALRLANLRKYGQYGMPIPP